MTFLKNMLYSISKTKERGNTMKKSFFNVFDGNKVNRIKAEDLVDFIKDCNGPVSVSFNGSYSGRIKLAPTQKNWIIKTNVNAKNCVVNQRRIVAIAKNHKRRIFSTIAECSNQLNIDDSNISKVLNGKRKTACGYRFEYI